MYLKVMLVFVSLSLLACSLAQACEQRQDCVPENSWQLGVAIGVGVRSNPLVDGDNIPLILLPDIAWYGETAYFDNGELGYQWYNNNKQAFTSFIHLDSERAFFSFWHPANTLSPLESLGGEVPVAGSDEPPRTELSKNDVASRDWAINAGIRWHYRLKNTEWKLTIEKDVSGVHQGEKLQISYQHHWQWRDWQISLTPALVWKSKKLIDYYYGIDARDKVDSQFFYPGSAGWQSRLSLTMQKPLNDKWLWLLRASHQRLHSGMSDSPLVRENNIQSVFFGLAYRF